MNSTETPRVAVVVVTYNSAGPLPGLLATVAEGLAGVRHHLVVVDNDSADDSVELTRRLAPDATIVQTGRNAGYSAGINAGIAAGSGSGPEARRARQPGPPTTRRSRPGRRDPPGVPERHPGRLA